MSKFVTTPKQLLSLSSADAVVPQAFTDAWAAVGNPINVAYCDSAIFRTSVVINSSNNPRFRLVEQVVTGGTKFTLPIETVSASDIKIEDQYLELNVDANQDMVLEFDVTGLNFITLQIQAGAVGTTGASLTSCIYNLVQDN